MRSSEEGRIAGRLDRRGANSAPRRGELRSHLRQPQAVFFWSKHGALCDAARVGRTEILFWIVLFVEFALSMAAPPAFGGSRRRHPEMAGGA